MNGFFTLCRSTSGLLFSSSSRQFFGLATLSVQLIPINLWPRLHSLCWWLEPLIVFMHHGSLPHHRAGALPHWHPVRFLGVDSIVCNDVKLKVCRDPQPHASPVARAISSITRIAVRMRACSHEPPCSHLLTVIGVRPMIAGNTGPRKSTFKSTSTVLPEYQAGVFCPALSHPRTP